MAENKHPTPNDRRSIVKNPTSPEYAADRQNRLDLGHPNVPPPPQGPSDKTK